MHKLLILSEHANIYRALIEEARLVNLEIVDSPADDVDIVLSDPNRLKNTLASLPALVWAQSIWAGVESLMKPSLRRNYILTNARGVFGRLMSEFVIGYMLAHERRIWQMTEDQKSKHWNHAETGSLRGKVIGLLGVGSIGADVAHAAKFFGMTVRGYTMGSEVSQDVDQYYHPKNPSSLLESFLSKNEELIQFTNGLDYLVNILPNTKNTRHVINADLLNSLPTHAVFINVGRGSAVDESALAKALKQKKIAGAVLDVCDHEPLAKSHPFWTTPNLHLTFHTAAPSFPEDIAKVFIENYKLFNEDKPLKYQVDFEKGY